MRSTLAKRIPRDLKKNFVKYLGMVIILVCTISIGSSFQATLNATVDYLDRIVDENLQEDGFFETANEIPEDLIDDFKDDKVSVFENYYATESEYNGDVKVVIYDERKDIDLPTVFEGRLPETDDEIIIDHVFARGSEIKVGDSITLIEKTYKICGTASFPDYSSLFLNNTDLVMNTKHFCVSMVTGEGFEEIDEKYITNRYSYRFDERDLKQSEKVTKAEEMGKKLLLTGNPVQSFLRADQNQCISFLPMDIGGDGPMMTVFVYMLIALIAFIFAILTNNTIESEAVIIGTLRASGYTKAEIMWHYLQPTLIVGVTGSLVGNILGYTAMIQPFINVYYTTYSVGPLEVNFDVKTFLITTIVPVVIMIGINMWMLASKLKLSPLKFLRKDLKKGKARRAVKLPNFSFLTRFRLRVIIQNRGSYLMLFFGIFFSSFLLMFGIGLMPLMNYYTDSINESLPYDYQYILKAPVDIDEGEKLYITELDTWFELGKKDIGITCYGIDKESEFFKDAYLEDGVSVSSSLAHKLNLNEGDTLKLTDSNTDKEYSFEIKKVYEYSASTAMFVDRESFLSLLDKEKDSYNSIVSGKKLDIDEMYIAKQITRSDVLGAADQMLDSFSTIISFINVFSVVVYLVMMYILTKVVIDKNALSISYMKVFGYEAKEIRKLFLTASTIVVVVSLVVCIPLEIYLFKLTLVYLSSMIEGYMEFYLPSKVYIEIVVIGIVSYLAINLIHIRDLNKIPMTDALKNRE